MRDDLKWDSTEYQVGLNMSAVNKLLDKALKTCSLNSDRALAQRMHVSPSAISLWRKGGQINEKHLTALIALADVDEATAIAVLAEQAETKPQKAVWNALLQRLGAAAAVLLVAALPFGAQAKAGSHFGINPDTAHYVTWWRYYGGVLRDWLAHRLQRPKPSPGCLEARTCL